MMCYFHTFLFYFFVLSVRFRAEGLLRLSTFIKNTDKKLYLVGAFRKSFPQFLHSFPNNFKKLTKTAKIYGLRLFVHTHKY